MVLSINDYKNHDLFVLPDSQFIYSATNRSTFPERGERMVNALLDVAPTFTARFDKVYDLDLGFLKAKNF